MTEPPTQPRMIAMDLDGTLLGTDGKVSERNIAAVRAAEDAGIVIATRSTAPKIAIASHKRFALPIWD